MTLQVPSDQKLPSLYLLDSIVKNIGRDYIKYFAARLPEVFCKAYRLVDPPLHQNMRHLFGTWKGVFPLQPLQVIEKELGFVPMINGSSSGTTTSRPDPPSQRSTQSIHVNPKYLEKQHPQQSSRTPGVGIGRTSGKVTDQGHNRPWHGTTSSVTETISSQRNGFNIKHGSQNYSTLKSVNADPRLLAAQNFAGRSSSRLSSSWKNSEEEEFMWEMHSRLSEHDAANISNYSRKDHWTPDVSEKLDFDIQPGKARSIHDVGSGFGRETSSDSPSTEQKDRTSYGCRVSSAWPFQDPQKTEELPSINSSHSENHPQPHSLLQVDAKPSHFSGKLNVGPHKHSPQASSASVSSFQVSYHHTFSQPPQPDLVQAEPSGQTQKPRLSPISKVGAASTLGNASEHTNPFAIETSELSSTSNLLAAVMKTGILSNSSFTGGLPSKIPEDVGQISSQPSLPNGPPPTVFTTSGLRADTATSSGSTSHDAIVANTNSSQGKVEQPPLPPEPPSSSFVSNSSVQASDAESKASTPIFNLLSSLVAKGLISASEKDVSSLLSLQVPTQMQKKSPAMERPTGSLNNSSDISNCSCLQASSIRSSLDAPRSSTMDEVSFAAPASKSSMEVENLIGLEFRPDVIREFHSSVISGLLDDLPHICSLCGLRLKLQEGLNRHLEWHAMKKTESKGSDRALRGWYARSNDWIAGKLGQLVFESIGSVSQLEKATEKAELMVSADENQYACMLCGELFEDYFSQDRGKWMFKGAVYLTILSKDGEFGTIDESAGNGPTVHANCMSETSAHDLGLAGGIKMEKEE
ncbi:hypothetical protein PTKIN_Ptkin13bG0252900 [Pterospermum kingtungense]